MTTEITDNEAVGGDVSIVDLDSRTTNLKGVQCLFCVRRYEDEHQLFNHLNYMHMIELVQFLASRPISRKVIEDKRMVTVNRNDISDDTKCYMLGVLDSIIGN